MSSLAFNAAPFNNNEISHNIKKKYKKTIKKRRKPSIQVQQAKRELASFDEFNNDGLSKFEPLTAPKLNKKKENINLIMNDNNSNIKPKNFHDTHNYHKHNSNEMTTTYYTDNNKHYISNDELLKKLNHIISILEEQKDQRTDYVSEELVLYSFLGIFIIYVVDSFARVGKYVR